MEWQGGKRRKQGERGSIQRAPPFPPKSSTWPVGTVRTTVAAQPSDFRSFPFPPSQGLPCRRVVRKDRNPPVEALGHGPHPGGSRGPHGRRRGAPAAAAADGKGVLLHAGVYPVRRLLQQQQRRRSPRTNRHSEGKVHWGRHCPGWSWTGVMLVLVPYS